MIGLTCPKCLRPHQESNLDLLLRREPFCPLNYGGIYKKSSQNVLLLYAARPFNYTIYA